MPAIEEADIARFLIFLEELQLRNLCGLVVI